MIKVAIIGAGSMASNTLASFSSLADVSCAAATADFLIKTIG